jgi:hypothetical protein
MVGIDLKPELEEMIKLIGERNSYSGNKISESIMKMFTVEITELHDGILVPYWLGVLERGRGPWRGSNIGNPLLRVRIYNWIIKHNLFSDKTDKERKGLAFVIARKINKLGNEQFRKGVFVDVYTSVRKATIEKIEKKFSDKISKITMEIL